MNTPDESTPAPTPRTDAITKPYDGLRFTVTGENAIVGSTQLVNYAKALLEHARLAGQGGKS